MLKSSLGEFLPSNHTCCGEYFPEYMFGDRKFLRKFGSIALDDGQAYSLQSHQVGEEALWSGIRHVVNPL